ncbi:hypothetical protein F157LOC_00783 [Pectobacterium brasiliense]|uniref:hypothetical protein n=1 Tax=Pectobacterium brasiliense TaxID=180957 RepID=UPI000CE68C70|nr:hypothetical protein [Pectobacterium brasiliense]PPE61949.1 hypothetical protein F157LOC_00783 [Pectobacterium brasiliense]
MLKREAIEAVIEEMAKLNGHELNGQDRLMIRTRLNSALAAKERHRKRIEADPYQWIRPSTPR